MTDQSNNQMNAWLRGQVERNNQAGRPATVGGAPTPAPVAVEAAPPAPPRAHAGAGTGGGGLSTMPESEADMMNAFLRSSRHGRHARDPWTMAPSFTVNMGR